MNKFHHLATKHKTYVDRLSEKFAKTRKFSFTKVDGNSIIVLDETGEKIDKFSSSTTFNQFVLVLESLGMIKALASGYEIVRHTFDWESAFDAIFTRTVDEQVYTYRQSRKIAFLYELNLVDQKFIDINNISKKRGELNLEDIKKEVSLFEKEGKNSFVRIIKFLERVKNEYKI